MQEYKIHVNFYTYNKNKNKNVLDDNKDESTKAATT